MILQPGVGPIRSSHYLRADAETISWGVIPTGAPEPRARVGSGETITIDAVSHEGILDDFGRDPVGWFGTHRLPRDAVEIALHGAREPDAGPHVITGPIHAHAREPGSGAIAYGAGRQARFPLLPFMGVMGVARAAGPVSSTPPGDFGGNIDVKHLQTGARLYLPVQVPGAGFYLGDPHLAQGNGEVCLTALEGSLRGDVRLTVLKGAEARALGGLISSPLVETDEHWIPIGIDADLDVALANATRNAVRFLEERFGMDDVLAYAYLSAAADFEISQAVNQVKVVRCKIRKRDFDS